MNPARNCSEPIFQSRPATDPSEFAVRCRVISTARLFKLLLELLELFSQFLDFAAELCNLVLKPTETRGWRGVIRSAILDLVEIYLAGHQMGITGLFLTGLPGNHDNQWPLLVFNQAFEGVVHFGQVLEVV